MYPVPAYSGAEIKIWYIKHPATLTSGTDTIYDGLVYMEPFMEVLAIYVATKLAIQENDVNKIQILSQQWAAGISAITATLSMSGGWNPGNIMGAK
jgi:hypothetical protein